MRNFSPQNVSTKAQIDTGRSIFLKNIGICFGVVDVVNKESEQ
jgi:hypothetical protein